MDAKRDATVRKVNALKNVLTCDDRDIVSAVTDAAKLAGDDAASRAMMLRAVDAMLAKLDNPDA
jgi:succinate dehydrogenase flavin-adding protein (antitoxin of CptAB toxin-antitoxin module)